MTTDPGATPPGPTRTEAPLRTAAGPELVRLLRMHAPEPARPEETLRAALAGLLDGLPPKQAVRAVDRLIANYRGRTPTDAPVLRDRSDVAAYAAYRMPATFEAVGAALDAFRDRGSGVGARLAMSTSAAAPVRRAGRWRRHGRTAPAPPPSWTGRSPPSPSAANWPAASETLRGAQWRRQAIDAGLALPATDLVTVSYVLGELTGVRSTRGRGRGGPRGSGGGAGRARHPGGLSADPRGPGPAGRRPGCGWWRPARTARGARSSRAPTGAISRPG